MRRTFSYLKFNSHTFSTTNLYRNLYLGWLRTGILGIAPVEAYLRGFVDEAGWGFRKVFYRSERSVRAIFDSDRHRVFGATAYLDQKREMEILCRAARESGKLLVVGGFLVSLTGEIGRALRQELFAINPDLLIVFGAGMGGQFLTNILTAQPGREREAPGVIWWDGRQERWNKPSAIITADQCFDIMNRNGFVPRDRHPYHPARDVTVFLQSGGCQYGKCSFCSRRAVCIGRVSTGKMLDILATYYRRGLRNFKTLEEDVLVFKDALRELPRLFAGKDICVDGQMGGQRILRHRELLEELLSSGIRLNVRWGAENGVDRILKFLGKDVSAAENYAVVDTLAGLAKRYPGRITTEMFLIDVVPDITMDELKEHLLFLSHCVENGIVIFSTIGISRLYYFPGSDLYRKNVLEKEAGPLPWYVTPKIEDARIEAMCSSFAFRPELIKMMTKKWIGKTAHTQAREYLARFRALAGVSRELEAQHTRTDG